MASFSLVPSWIVSAERQVSAVSLPDASQLKLLRNSPAVVMCLGDTSGKFCSSPAAYKDATREVGLQFVLHRSKLRDFLFSTHGPTRKDATDPSIMQERHGDP